MIAIIITIAITAAIMCGLTIACCYVAGLADECLEEVDIGGERMTKRIDVNDRKYYLEIDKIGLVYEEGELVGWYSPSGFED